MASSGDRASSEEGLARDGAGLLFRALQEASDKHEQIAAREVGAEATRRESAAAAAVADAANLTYGQFTNRPEVRDCRREIEKGYVIPPAHTPSDAPLTFSINPR